MNATVTAIALLSISAVMLTIAALIVARDIASAALRWIDPTE